MVLVLVVVVVVACSPDDPNTLGVVWSPVLTRSSCPGTQPGKSIYDFMPFPRISRPQAGNYWRL